MAGRRHAEATTGSQDGNREQAALDRAPVALYIGGEWRPASGGGTLAVEDPSTGETLAEVADATPEDALAALAAAAEAQAAGPRRAPRERGEILRRAYELLLRARRRAGAVDDARDGQGARPNRAPRSSMPPSSCAGSPRRRCASTGAT